MRCFGLPPIINDESRVLVLGSMPGRESLERRQYYANPRNQFWAIVSEVIGEKIPLEYDGKIAFLLRHHIALWDVLSSCERTGSSDNSIRNAVANDFSKIFKANKSLRLVVFNGSRAESLWKKHVRLNPPPLGFIRLPSTSTALARPFEEKLSAWLVIREYL